MRLEQIETRVLGAVRFVDSTTGLRITSPLSVRADGLSFTRNRSGHYVIASAVGLEAHTKVFEKPPAEPELGKLTFNLTVDDPTRLYLSRQRTIKLPRDSDPKNAGNEDSLFKLIDVQLFPSSIAATGSGWAVIRASVVRKDTKDPLGAALIRVTKKNGNAADETKPLGRGLTDKRGEALVTVPGIPITTFGEDEGAVTVKEIDVTITAFFDPKATGIPDPDDLETRRATLKNAKIDIKLAPGRIVPLTLELTLS